VGLGGTDFPASDSDFETIAVSGLTRYIAQICMADKLSERVRLRLRDEMTRKNVSQRDLADLLDTNQSRISKLLNGHVDMRVDDLEQLAFGLGLPIVEVIRDQGLEFFAEMTPTELRLFHQMRREPDKFAGVLALFEVRTKTNKPERYAGRSTDKKVTRR
jgi:transcriptional regulator with XRE-family HTH domain